MLKCLKNSFTDKFQMLFPCNKVNNISAVVYSAFGAMEVYNNEYEGSTKLLDKKVEGIV